MIIHDVSIQIVPYFYRADFELSADIIFDTIGPVFLLKRLGWKQAIFVWCNGSLCFYASGGKLALYYWTNQ